MRTLMLATFLALALSAPAKADFLTGHHYYKQGEFIIAHRIWLDDARLGDPRSQLNLGVMYTLGRGVKRDHAEAAKWFGRAADQGNTKAQYNLGLAYYRGRGVEKDATRAAGLFRASAAKNFARAQYMLGLLHEKGRGLERDLEAALELYLNAANAG